MFIAVTQGEQNCDSGRLKREWPRTKKRQKRKLNDTKAQLNKQKFQKPEGKNYMEVPRETRRKHQSSTAKLADNGEEEQAFYAAVDWS